jgi:hypothetical protein
MTKHTCFDDMNARLKPHNAKIAHGIRINHDLNKLTASYFVQTEKLDTNVRIRKKPPLVIMTHCPFCGIDLDKAQET